MSKGRGRPPVDQSKLIAALEKLRNGATIGEAAKAAGVHRNTLGYYGITKNMKRLRAGMIALPQPDPLSRKLWEIEMEIAASFQSAIDYAHTPLIATAEVAQMESERLYACVRAERLRNAGRRLDR